MTTDPQKLEHLKLLFTSWFGSAPRETLVYAQAPGRLELAGNHTDHQGGLVISAALDRHIFALAAPNGTHMVRARMGEFGNGDLSLAEPDAFAPREDERGTSVALLRGMAAAYAAAGGHVVGFDLVTCSDLPAGAGVSSSAAFEMLMGVVLRALDGHMELTDDERIAMALQGQNAEHDFFGKTCGAQDQIASAFGGAVFMDFSPKPPAPPLVQRVPFDVTAMPWRLVLVDSKVDHSRYNADYDSVPADMFACAREVGAARLGDVKFAQFRKRISGFEFFADNGMRATSRARHFYAETNRVAKQYKALCEGRYTRFVRLAGESGRSNRESLMNVVPMSAAPDDVEAKRPALIMDECDRILGDAGVCRMHGGGFGGSILAIMKPRRMKPFMAEMNALLGYDACMPAAITPAGAGAQTVDPELPGRIAWTGRSRFGELELTVNLRKPEKDPRAIAAAAVAAAATGGAAKPCDLCQEVQNFNPATEAARDPRVAASGAEFTLDGEHWMLHFSPYGYYPLHCIALTDVHRPMKIDEGCLRRLLACVDRFPYYFMGSNADLPIVGGSILAHDHFQGGGHVFPLMRAPLRYRVVLKDFPGLTCGIVDWPSSTLRLEGDDAEELVAAATKVLDAWRHFDFAPCDILSCTDDTPHSTITPIAYKRSFVASATSTSPVASATGTYVLDLVLRNNRTSAQRPFGIFHPDESLHHIKKENIGLIEIMGLAVLPGRLAREIPGIESDRHAQQRVTEAFVHILESTGVFKRDARGKRGWMTFLGGINGEIQGVAGRY